jgi:aminobenzoyl-glutamate utilization protein A
MSLQERDRLVELRRDLHRHPEVGWTEFYTTARIVEELERIGVDELHLGPEVLDTGARLGVPDEERIEAAYERAIEDGASADVLEGLRGGYTGAVAVVEQGAGPTVALRVDIDGLPREEASAEDHHPVHEGFRSGHEGEMHACGHDAHATIGLGVLEAVKESDFEGTLKLLFQPAEEVIGGGKPMAEGGHLDDVDYLLALHVGLGHPTGEVVAGIDGFLAVTQFRAEFEGEPAHAGATPDEGRNAVQAMATAVNELYAIPRHHEGATRVNAGDVGGGSAMNIIPEEAYIVGEVRGETTDLRDYVAERARDVVEHAGGIHGCGSTFEVHGEAPSATSDEELVAVVHDVATETAGVDSPVRRGELGGSEDATYLMQYVQNRGGHAAYVGIGTDHPGGHHTATFDVDEDSIPIGVELLSEAIRRIATERP